MPRQVLSPVGCDHGRQGILQSSFHCEQHTTAIPLKLNILLIEVKWDAIEKSSIQERKIRVVFLPPGGAQSGGSHLETPSKPSAANGVCFLMLLAAPMVLTFLADSGNARSRPACLLIP